MAHTRLPKKKNQLCCLFVFKINMTSSDTSKSLTANTKGIGQNGDTGFKTRQRPDAIRNSNIVAAKGNKGIDLKGK
jgi:hypothetical protein